MLESIGAALGSLNAAKDLVQAFSGVQTASAVLDVKLDLQRHLLSAYEAIATAQQDLTTLEGEKRQLEQRIMSFEDWEAEARKYELADAGNGCLAYRNSPLVPSAEPDHWLCPRCYQDRKKSILQPVKHAGMTETLECPACNASLMVRGRSDRLPGRAR